MSLWSENGFALPALVSLLCDDAVDGKATHEPSLSLGMGVLPSRIGTRASDGIPQSRIVSSGPRPKGILLSMFPSGHPRDALDHGLSPGRPRKFHGRPARYWGAQGIHGQPQKGNRILDYTSVTIIRNLHS